MASTASDAREANPTRGAHVAESVQAFVTSGAPSRARGERTLASAPMTDAAPAASAAPPRTSSPRRLAAAGWEIVERNARTRYGELDIVALDGRALVFVEVKAGRAGSAFGPERPVLAVDRRKQRRSAASPPPGWPSAATAPLTPRSASTPSASPSTAGRRRRRALGRF